MARHRFPPGSPDPKDLERFGPRLEIEVGPPIVGSRKKLGQRTYPDQRSGTVARMPALIDIGASRTVMTPEAIEKVGLPLVDYATLSRAGGMDKVAVYTASIQFPRYRLGSIEVIQVLCCELPLQPIQCLIGRDILSRWLFTYHGQTGEWSIGEEEITLLPWVSPPQGNPPQINPPWVEPAAGVYEVFVSHASEDKAFVDPLVSALKTAGIRVWYDKDEMKWGDNLRSSIDIGLLNSRFAIVVLSKAYFRRKRWTEHELNGLFARERAGKTIILPIWHEVTQDDIGEYSPAFVDRIALDSQKNSTEEIIRALKSLIRRDS